MADRNARAQIRLHGRPAGQLSREASGEGWRFEYLAGYDGPPLSVTLPVSRRLFTWDSFPPFFEGLLPEGVNRESLLRAYDLEETDLFGMLLAAGEDTVGAITVSHATEGNRS